MVIAAATMRWGMVPQAMGRMWFFVLRSGTAAWGVGKDFVYVGPDFGDNAVVDDVGVGLRDWWLVVVVQE